MWHKIQSAFFKEPQWIPLSDYEVEAPSDLLDSIRAHDGQVGRRIQEHSLDVAKYGEFLNDQGDLVRIDGVIFRYTMEHNPRKSAHAFRLLMNDEVVDSGSELNSYYEAKDQCNHIAKNYIENHLSSKGS